MTHSIYIYKASTADGEIVTGELSALSEKAVAMLLQQRGLIPIRIYPAGNEADPSAGLKPGGSRAVAGSKALRKSEKNSHPVSRSLTDFLRNRGRCANTRDLVIFCQDLSALLDAGIPLARSLKIVAELIEKKKFKEVILDLHEQIKEGTTFWQALEKHRNVFNPVFINMIKAGESSGALEGLLVRLSQYLDGVQELKEYLLSAMMYPMFLLVTAMGSIIVLLAVVVPKFATIFSDMGVALPLTTQVMMFCGTFLKTYGWLLAVLFGLGVFALRYYHGLASGRYRIDALKIHLPVLGTLLRKIEISRFCRTFGTLLHSGVPILSALQMARGVFANVVLNGTIDEVCSQLKQGRILSEALTQTGFFPMMALQMIAIGEETGHMDNMLMRVSDIYDREIKTNIKTFTSLFEPLIILAMGLVIGAMVVSMLLAIFSINDLGI